MVKSEMKLERIIRIFLAFIFLFAALFRIFNFSAGQMEMVKLGLPVYLTFLVIILELIICLSFFFNRFVKYSTLLAILFLFVAIIIAIMGNLNNIIKNIWELFVFTANPTDIFLHITYLFLLIVLFYYYINKKVF